MVKRFAHDRIPPVTIKCHSDPPVAAACRYPSSLNNQVPLEVAESRG